jgi:hypothetical protein
MPTCIWAVNVDAAMGAIERRFPTAGGGLLRSPSGAASWARFAVEHLYYLADVDVARTRGPHPNGHTPQTIDYAHGEWATSTALTAIDRCAACLGEGLLGPKKKSEHAYDHRDLKSKANAEKIAGLSPTAAGWVESVDRDPEYSVLLAFRNPLVHAYVAATGQVSTGPITARNALRVDVDGASVSIPVDELVDRCCSFAKLHVERFLQLALSPGF